MVADLGTQIKRVVADNPGLTGSEIADRVDCHWWQRSKVLALLAGMQKRGEVAAHWQEVPAMRRVYSQAGAIPSPPRTEVALSVRTLDTYACHRCGMRDGLDAVVSDKVWATVSGRNDGGGLLCLWCMDEIAAEKGLGPLRVELFFAGRALFSAGTEEAVDG